MANTFLPLRHAMAAACAMAALASPDVWAGTFEAPVDDVSGASGTWVVPAGVTRIDIVAAGAGGGHIITSTSPTITTTRGGYGARVEARGVSVTPGTTLQYFVGGGGFPGASFSSGGGATQLGIDLNDPWVIAGGGGGAGGGVNPPDSAVQGGDGCAAGGTGGAGGNGAGSGGSGIGAGIGGSGGIGGIGGSINDEAGGNGNGGYGGLADQPPTGGAGFPGGLGIGGRAVADGSGAGGGGYGGGGSGMGGGAGGSLWPGMTSGTPNSPTCVPEAATHPRYPEVGAPGRLIITWGADAAAPTPVPSVSTLGLGLLASLAAALGMRRLSTRRRA